MSSAFHYLGHALLDGQVAIANALIWRRDPCVQVEGMACWQEQEEEQEQEQQERRRQLE